MGVAADCLLANRSTGIQLCTVRSPAAVGMRIELTVDTASRPSKKKNWNTIKVVYFITLAAHSKNKTGDFDFFLISGISYPNERPLKIATTCRWF
jgi:hypothetical protein